MYTYKATVLKVVDGDTVDIDIDLGFTIHVRQRVRLAGINAPEKNTEEGMASATFLRERLPVGHQVLIKSSKPGGGDKYGRYLAWIIEPSTDENINVTMVTSGHAFEWDGVGEKPV